jgi:hypothetical protein
MIIKNYTPHDISIYTPDGDVQTHPSVGNTRVSSTNTPLDSTGLPCPVVSCDVFTSIIDLPDPEDGVVFIVSAVVGTALRESGISRPDIYCPGTGPKDNPVRNADKQVIGVRIIKRATH